MLIHLAVLLFCSIVSNSLQAQEAGRYWINIMQTGKESFVIRFEITGGEDLTLRTVRIPEIIDASKIPGTSQIRPLTEERVDIQVSFMAEGSGELWVLAEDPTDEGRKHFIVFDLFNHVRGTTVIDSVSKAAGSWNSLGGSASVMQFGTSVAKCSQDLGSNIQASGIFESTSALTGIVLKGSASELNGAVSSINPSGWGLSYTENKIGRVASLLEVGKLDPEQTTQTRTDQTGSDTQTDTTVTEKLTESENTTEARQTHTDTDTDTNTNAENRVDRRTVETPGPAMFSTTTGSILGVSPRRNWTGEGNEGGHFGETILLLPIPRPQLKSVNSVELVLRVIPRGTGYGNIRIRMSTTPTLPSARRDKLDGFWLAGRQLSPGFNVSEISLENQSKEYRFNIGRWIGSNRSRSYFVSVLNLSSSTLDIEDVHIEVKGIR
jgi:hypothetical protein